MNLDRRITFRKKQATTNSYGEEIITWVDFVSVWAKKEDLKADERYMAAQLQGEITTRFTIRYRTDITTDMLIVHDGVEYDIDPPMERGRRDYSVIGAKAHV
jgi:SPP1 family predicted phage head-tail adaptor